MIPKTPATCVLLLPQGEHLSSAKGPWPFKPGAPPQEFVQYQTQRWRRDSFRSLSVHYLRHATIS